MRNINVSSIKEGIWPTMLTPFDTSGAIDYKGLEQLVEWYIAKGVAGLFAVCQSSEMFFLSRQERKTLASAVVRYAAGRVPVIASGHISDSLEEQHRDIVEIAETGVDAVVLVSNRLVGPDGDESEWFKNLNKLLGSIPESIDLGIYECPYPRKHLLTTAMLEHLGATGRFLFLKDTTSDPNLLSERAALKGLRDMKLFNANSATLLESWHKGYSGFSGVMANFHPELYRWLWDNRYDTSGKAEALQALLGLASMIESFDYPLNAKYYLKMMGLPIEVNKRNASSFEIAPSTQVLIGQLARQSTFWEQYVKGEEGIR
jgi:4-hydroxy-tetrahydrodipicolinate synthase